MYSLHVFEYKYISVLTFETLANKIKQITVCYQVVSDKTTNKYCKLLLFTIGTPSQSLASVIAWVAFCRASSGFIE